MKKMLQLKIIVEKYPEGDVAYPLGLKTPSSWWGDTYEEALEEAKSAIQFHIETFGKEVFDTDNIIETFVAEVTVELYKKT